MNCDVAGSKCWIDDPANCAIYGRLYDRATAMSVCPVGWHLPSKAEWDKLRFFIESDQGCSLCDAKHLKATRGWRYKGNGLDTYGFAALPGSWFSDGFGITGYNGYWWNATENYYRTISYSSESASWDWDFDSPPLLSVRCVQDYSSSSKTGSSSSVAAADGSCDIDISDYKTVEIGTQTWMAENLNCDVSLSKCYDNDPANCAKYGRLYDWATAMALPSKCNSTLSTDDVDCAKATPNHQGLCPSGYHIPSDADWNVLMKFVNPSCSDNRDCAGAGTKLRAKEGWNLYNSNFGSIPAGTDEYGFAALPGGYGSVRDFGNIRNTGFWWSASEYHAYYAYYRSMSYKDEKVSRNDDGKHYLRSIRCVQD